MDWSVTSVSRDFAWNHIEATLYRRDFGITVNVQVRGSDLVDAARLLVERCANDEPVTTAELAEILGTEVMG